MIAHERPKVKQGALGIDQGMNGTFVPRVCSTHSGHAEVGSDVFAVRSSEVGSMEQKLQRVPGGCRCLMGGVQSAATFSVIDACTQDCANLAFRASFRENSSHSARQGVGARRCISQGEGVAQSGEVFRARPCE